ncbi:hypothetical protein XENTR_v10000454 [Xenopus tropicalis]|uniref:Uncharacterized protein LOC100493503 n=1 Tax=Xenopus tropicalis TaxID=8364 RepID=A0A8J0QU65_XENTR|nr:uncharacterized protein LOC100493503 [Xenopus tropicalis]XP_002938693.1 uncharacterized protein LOC100493503 [Xenopus tropicalis]KAE8629355.1 hypothetical protein XENTR_v10000454 [Xenopus tropicalis]KAE8629356.1 hypothetical protein XENTR_v10000454 [Xenopus tropicalis]|eukprot:XP_002938692.1 PREDICTED: uncharacterized protein LOC100493503 [Xenopus tropicalis]
MGCNCCRLCHSYAIETDGVQGNGYVNEALSCPPSVKDWSRTQTITITDLLNEEQKKLERDRLSGLQDPHAGEEKNNEKNYEIDPPTYILDLNSHGENNYYSSPTDTPRQQDNDIKRISEEPECFQHQFINSAQKTSSLTESAILDVLNDDLLLKHSDHKSGSPTSNQEHAQKSHGHPPEVPVSDHKSVTVLMCEEPIVKDKSSLVALMLARNSLRGTSGSTVHPQNEDLDPDVAEALAALAAALAGEYFEDS